MQQLRIEDLLRYGFSGGLLFIALYITFSWGPQAIVPFSGVTEVTLVLGVVILTGSLIYTVHRAILYPLLLFPLALVAAAALGSWPFDRDMVIPMRQSEVELHLERMRMQMRRQLDPLDVMFSEWGAQVHFLHCSWLAIILATQLGRFVGNTCNATAYNFLLIAAAIMFVGACVSNVRLLQRLGVELDTGHWWIG